MHVWNAKTDIITVTQYAVTGHSAVSNSMTHNDIFTFMSFCVTASVPQNDQSLKYSSVTVRMSQNDRPNGHYYSNPLCSHKSFGSVEFNDT